MSRLRCGFAVVAVVAATAALSSAHEIKVLASRLLFDKDGGKTTVYLSWGHRLPVDELIDAAVLERYELRSPAGTVTALKKEGLSLQESTVEVKEPGVHQLLVTRKAGVFTRVIDADGNRLMKRGPKTEVKEGKIEYALRSQQSAKALIVVGEPSKEPIKPIGLALEIVPQDGPAVWTSKNALNFLVLLDGKPLPNAEVTARYIGFKPDDAWTHTVKTDANGVAIVTPGQAGAWVLKASHRIETTGTTRDLYDYESFVTTLALEVQP